MKILLTLVLVAFLGLPGMAQADNNQENPPVEEAAIEDMPRFASIEQQRCPKSRYPSVKKRLECKHEVRREIFEKRQEREKAESQNLAQTSKTQGNAQ